MEVLSSLNKILSVIRDRCGCYCREPSKRCLFAAMTRVALSVPTAKIMTFLEAPRHLAITSERVKPESY